MSSSAVDVTVKRALEYLAGQHELSYPDAAHVMGSYSTKKFTELYGRSRSDDNAGTFAEFRCVGAVYHVATITEALLDAADAGHHECGRLADDNAAWLLSQRDGVSWRYFPGFEPLPHDADTLAQVLRVLLRTGRADNADVRTATAFAARNAWDDGVVNTWLLDVPDDRAAANRVWGRGRDDTGRDPDVVANLAHATLLHERKLGVSALSPLVGPATRWLLEQQQPMGFWRASWYVGTCYSTYAAVRHLVAVGGHEDEIARATRFLAQAPAPDPLNRALAMLALTTAGRAVSTEDCDLLAGSQFPDGSWEAVPWLDNHARVWGSRAVTTALCLKALLAVQSGGMP
ncbi:hypothetical protein SK854_04540 [Lentzea sp. BCCO 10_0061]|uniref:Prenyltransferase n=1 Tax=Lentzea sokolovensis TaxID=3095429 RepID=A0ABU4UPM5_9PSEU|nr:hypothetical protein [Lentzea sp. BCCO 10_0061]MDX8141369.1 hypothetical protein [Lentzea sp. BCCO 10_0061]